MIDPFLLSRKLIEASALDWRAMRTNGCGFRYFYSKWYALLLNSRQMNYLGHPINYDSYFSPFFMFSFVDEIEKHVLQYITSHRPIVLDVGANYGGWAQTLKSLVPNSRVYSFEPNTEIFNILLKNSGRFHGWSVFNFGISSTSTTSDFFYVPGKSAQGSVYENNSALNILSAKPPRKIRVNLRRFENTELYERGITRYDFVKIDVEGGDVNGLFKVSHFRS